MKTFTAPIPFAGAHRRADFSRQTERLANLAANRAVIGFEEAQLLSEQKRVRSEHGRRVAKRTKELAEAHRELQLQVGLLQQIPVAAWMLKPDGTPDFVNRVWFEYTGQTIDFVRSRPQAWMNAVHPEDRPPVADSFWNGVRSGQNFAVETRLRRARDGVYRWHLNRAVALRDTGGRVLRFVGTSTDIDDRKRAEEALRASERNFHQILDNIPGYVCKVNSIGEIDYVNRRFLEYFDKTLEELRGWKTNDVVHPDDLPRVIAAYTGSIVSGTPLVNEHRCRRADGVYRWFQARGLPLRDAEGNISGFCFLLTDIEDQKRAEEESRTSENNLRSELAHMARVTSLGALTASIAHEVNQPLSGIVTNANTCLRMLAAVPPNIDGARETARRAIRDGKRASAVIALLRAIFSKKQVTMKQVDLNEATQEVIALSLSEIQRNGAILRQEFANDLDPVTGDRVQLQQVVLNLVRNALDAMRGVDNRLRELVIRTEREEGDCVRLTVRDTGAGVDPKNLNKLFEAFYTTKDDGMGMGLSISRNIIESHHGRLWAAPNDGPGATFSFSIPCGSQGRAGTGNLVVTDAAKPRGIREG